MTKFFIAFAAFILSLLCHAQIEQAQPVLIQGVSNSWDFSWHGIVGRTYFIQHSYDLVNWQYFPIIETGMGQSLNYEVATTDRKLFLRLVYSDSPSGGNPGAADFDYDGVNNFAELQAGLDPLRFEDLDKNGLPDEWEIFHDGSFAVYPGELSAQIQVGDIAVRHIILNNATNNVVSYNIAIQNNEIPIYSYQSSANGGPSFSWDDVSSTGTLLPMVSDGDDESEIVNMSQFSFPYYGSSYSAVHVSSNGYITLDAPSAVYNNTKLPMPSSPSLLIAPLWDDLNPGAGGDVYVKEFSDRMIIQYQQIASYSDAGTLTFQVVLHSNGEIDFRYLNLTANVNTCTVGIQNTDGTHGLQVAFNEAYLTNQMALRIRPLTAFFTLNSYAGTIPGNSTTSIIGTFSAGNMNPGTYMAQVQVSQNGEVVSPITISATATVTEPDTDGDGMPDRYEIANDLNPLANDVSLDHDEDALTNIQEYHLATLANQPDTDGDGLGDGWEHSYGYSPLLNNLTDGDPRNDPTADPDNDRLTNAAEYQRGTNPLNADTDGDGSDDLIEDKSGSNPTNPASVPNNPGGTPGGPATPPPPTINVEVHFGDHSGSHSEKYRVCLEPLEGDANTQKRYRINSNYGETQSETFNLPAGAKYKITINHIGTDPQYQDSPRPDYDYTLEFSSNSTDAAISAITEDNDGILAVHDESDNFFAEGKDAKLYIAWLTSETVATQPSDRKRNKIGVGEEVNITLKPVSLPSSTWTLTGTPGNSTLSPINGISSMLTAGGVTCRPTSVATINGESVSIDFEVIEPSSVTFVKASTTLRTYPSIGLTMTANIFVGPGDVNFANITVQEGQCAAITSGYYNYQNGLNHPASIAPLPMTSTVDPSRGTQVNGQDTIGGGTQGPPYSPGTFMWQIPLNYTSRGQTKQFIIINHEKNISVTNDKATLVISKNGASDSVTQP